MSRNIALLFVFVGFLFFSGKSQDSLRYVQLSGKIINEAGEPIANVKVENKTRLGVRISSDKGFFSIVVVSGDVIQLSHVGRNPIQVKIPTNASKNIFEVFELPENSTEIQEVVVSMPGNIADYIMDVEISEDEAKELAKRNPDMFNILDTIVEHKAKLVQIDGAGITGSPITWAYDRIQDIKEKMKKPGRKDDLPTYKKEKQ